MDTGLPRGDSGKTPKEGEAHSQNAQLSLRVNEKGSSREQRERAFRKVTEATSSDLLKVN